MASGAPKALNNKDKTMAHDAPSATGPSKLVIRNIGLLLSGALEKPILDADTIVAENGKITAIGRLKDVDTEDATTVVNANGTTVAPGLIDSHVHPVAGDWTPRQNQTNWIDSYLHGGVTTMISAGEVHMPGRPRDVVGLKAMAIFAQRSFWTLRPGGVKVHAGAPVIECEMVEDDFKELAAAGVKLLGEVGLGGVKDGPTARKMVGWARKYGIQSTIHTGGPSIPGSGLIDKDVVLEADTDVVGHINGGHTALPDDQIRCICEGCAVSNWFTTATNARRCLRYASRARWATSTASFSAPMLRPARACNRSASCAWFRCCHRSASCRPKSPSASPPATPPGCVNWIAASSKSAARRTSSSWTWRSTRPAETSCTACSSATSPASA
jgi:hypothetical protein